MAKNLFGDVYSDIGEDAGKKRDAYDKLGKHLDTRREETEQAQMRVQERLNEMGEPNDLVGYVGKTFLTAAHEGLDQRVERLEDAKAVVDYRAKVAGAFSDYCNEKARLVAGRETKSAEAATEWMNQWHQNIRQAQIDDMANTICREGISIEELQSAVLNRSIDYKRFMDGLENMQQSDNSLSQQLGASMEAKFGRPDKSMEDMYNAQQTWNVSFTEKESLREQAGHAIKEVMNKAEQMQESEGHAGMSHDSNRSTVEMAY